MRKEGLVGMAAPQIGEAVRIFVVKVRETKYRNNEKQPLEVFINPVIIDVSDETQLGYEGCGSVAHGGLFGEVKRHKDITVEYTNSSGNQCLQTFRGFVAVIIQHEMDHINSIEFTDISDPKSFVSKEYYLEHIRGKK